MMEPPSGLVGASVPTGPPFLSFLLLFSFFVPIPSFPQKMSRQERLATTIPNPVDLQPPPLVSSPAPFTLSLSQSRSPPAFDSPRLDADVRDGKSKIALRLETASSTS